jgi:hypothetical protein
MPRIGCGRRLRHVIGGQKKTIRWNSELFASICSHLWLKSSYSFFVIGFWFVVASRPVK